MIPLSIRFLTIETHDARVNAPGIRHIAVAVENIDAVVAGLRARGADSSARWSATRTATALLRPRPEGSIVELAEQLG